MVPRLGGPMGRHAVPRGLWFNPTLWVLLVGTGVFLLLFLRHTPCVQVSADNPINAYIRACYSDIQTTYLSQGYGQGAPALNGQELVFSPLTAALVQLTLLASTWVFGAPAYPGASLQDQVDASVVFFALTAVALYVCLVVALLCLVGLGRSSRGRTPSWDAMLVAASPVLLAVGLINWDLFGIALTCLGLLLFARRGVIEAGLVLGLGACASVQGIWIVAAVAAACALRSPTRTMLKFVVPAVGAFLMVHVPLLLANWRVVYLYYHGQIAQEAGYGSWWYLLTLLGVPLTEIGPLAYVLLVSGLCILLGWLYVTRRRPRVGALIAVVLFASALMTPAAPPQTALWLLVALVLSRPYRPELIAFTVTQVAYYLAIWGWLGGALTTAQSGPYGLYWLAIVARVAVEAWILVECVRDLADPRRVVT